MNKKAQAQIPIVMIAIIAVVLLVLAPGVIKVWQWSFFTNFKISSWQTWAVIGFLVLVMLRANKRKNGRSGGRY